MLNHLAIDLIPANARLRGGDLPARHRLPPLLGEPAGGRQRELP